jgi:hypothetical protein
MPIKNLDLNEVLIINNTIVLFLCTLTYNKMIKGKKYFRVFFQTVDIFWVSKLLLISSVSLNRGFLLYRAGKFFFQPIPQKACRVSNLGTVQELFRTQ